LDLGKTSFLPIAPQTVAKIEENEKKDGENAHVAFPDKRFVKEIMEPAGVMRGDEVPVSALMGIAGGTYPPGTTALEKRGAEVKFAIHPVAGRMPGHMSVLLCEADVDYDRLVMMEDINPEFAECDLAIVIGANDVTNPAANTAEDTPIYGMPVLDVEKAPMAVFCNFDTKPGYAGVPNPLYEAENVLLMLGDAKESVNTLRSFL
jgi:hypothetical protein